MSESTRAASRRDEIEAALTATRERIAAACAATGRSPDDVTLIVVTKFHPAGDIVLLGELGVRDIGENRHQEAEAKLADLAQELPAGHEPPTMHFIGQAQRNKAAAIARYADVVHSVDRDRLVVALDRGAERAGRTLDVLLQVDLDPEPDPGRGGVIPAEVAALADAPFVAQVIIGLAVAAALLGVVRPVAKRHLVRPEEEAIGTARYVGRGATVTQTVTDDSGLVRVDGDVWTARVEAGELSVPVDAPVRIVEVRGATLVVTPAEPVRDVITRGD